MAVSISGKHIEIGSALQEYVRKRIDSGVRLYLSDITQAKIVFSKRSFAYHADIIIHDSHAGLIKSESESDDVYAAFDAAIIKIEKQLRKYKGKIRAHAKRNKEDYDSFSGIKYVLNVPANEEQHDNVEENYCHEPVTIAEKPTNIEKLTVSEAVMKMDLAHLPALLFINKSNNRLNVVYHRVDGNISWVDPGEINVK